LTDINKATQEDLIKIYGVGEVISLRILKLKEGLGSFHGADERCLGTITRGYVNLIPILKFLHPNIEKIDIITPLKEIVQLY
jgi:hypothetical protein